MTSIASNVIPALSRDPPSFQRHRWKAEVLGEIAPRRIDRMNEVVLPRSRPALNSLFARNRLVHRFVDFEPDKALDPVSLGEAAHHAFAMLPDTARQVRSYARVQRAVRRSREQVDTRLPVGVHCSSKAEGRSRLKAGMTNLLSYTHPFGS